MQFPGKVIPQQAEGVGNPVRKRGESAKEEVAAALPLHPAQIRGQLSAPGPLLLAGAPPALQELSRAKDHGGHLPSAPGAAETWPGGKAFPKVPTHLGVGDT